jgi:hypothetical protein
MLDEEAIANLRKAVTAWRMRDVNRIVNWGLLKNHLHCDPQGFPFFLEQVIGELRAFEAKFAPDEVRRS